MPTYLDPDWSSNEEILEMLREQLARDARERLQQTFARVQDSVFNAAYPIDGVPPVEEETMLRFVRSYCVGFVGSVYTVKRDWNTLGKVRYGSGPSRYWEYSVDGNNWNRASGNSRWEAANDLLEYAGYAPMPAPAQARRMAERNRSGRRSGRPAVRSQSSEGRIFGVEMELTGPDAGTIIRALTDAGIRMSRGNLNSGRELQYQHTNTEQNVWTLKRDGSVQGYGLELVSPKLRGEAGFQALKTVCEALNSVGATVDRSCGLHVHHDFRNVGLDSMKRQVLAMVERQDLMMQLVAPSRRNNATYTPLWAAPHVRSLEALQTLQHVAVGPRGTVNLWSYAVHGSVEVRAHAGTTNYRKIAAWVRFGQAVFAAGEAGESIATDTPQNLLADLLPYGLTAEDASWLLRFVEGGTRQEREERIAAMQDRIAALESVVEEVSA